MDKENKIFIGIVIGALIVGGFVYLTFKPGSPTGLAVLSPQEPELEGVKQVEVVQDDFPNYDGLHWGHMPITYGIRTECPEKVEARIHDAFSRITSETRGKVLFKEIEGYPDIRVFCKPYESYSTIGYIQVIYGDELTYFSESDENLIVGSDINFYGAGSVCLTGYPALEVHEILHALGIEHNYRLHSIMRPEVEGPSNECKITGIDKEIVPELEGIYF